MSKLIGLTQYTCREYTSGEIVVDRSSLDLVTRRMTTETVLKLFQTQEPRFTPSELVLAAAAGVVAEAIYFEYGVDS